MLIAHRGGVANTCITENTLPAFRRAMANAVVDGIECDLRITADGVVVIHHDVALTDGRPIAALQWKDLPAHVPTLQDLLRLTTQSGYQGLLNLEIKTYNTLDKVLDILNEFPAIRPLQILLTSFLHTEIKRHRESGYSRGIVLACQPHCSFEYLLSAEGRPDKLVLCDHNVNWTDPDIVTQLERMAPDVFLWTVNDPTRVKYLRSKGFHVITDVLPTSSVNTDV